MIILISQSVIPQLHCFVHGLVTRIWPMSQPGLSHTLVHVSPMSFPRCRVPGARVTWDSGVSGAQEGAGRTRLGKVLSWVTIRTRTRFRITALRGHQDTPPIIDITLTLDDDTSEL